jgi:hypothetical protein
MMPRCVEMNRMILLPPNPPSDQAEAEGSSRRREMGARQCLTASARRVWKSWIRDKVINRDRKAMQNTRAQDGHEGKCRLWRLDMIYGQRCCRMQRGPGPAMGIH